MARILKALLVAVLLNAVLFWIGKGTGIIAPDVLLPNVQQPLTLGPVVLSSALSVLVAALILYLLSRWLPNPNRAFNALAVGVLLLSFVAPFLIPGASLLMAVLLNLMHVVVAGSVLYCFGTLSSQSKPGSSPVR